MAYPYGPVDPDLEISGYVLQAILTDLSADSLLPVLRKHNLDSIDIKKWYFARYLVDFVVEVCHLPQSNTSLKNIGITAGGFTRVPVDYSDTSIMDFFDLLEGTFQSGHRNGNAGKHTFKQVGPTCAIVTVSTFYPDEVEFGWLQHMLKIHPIFSTIDYDPRAPTREEGARTTRFEVRWWE